MSQVLEWRERLENAHKQMHEALTELITNKNYSEAERRLHCVDQLMLDLVQDMGGTSSDPAYGPDLSSSSTQRRCSPRISSANAFRHRSRQYNATSTPSWGQSVPNESQK